MADGLGGVLVGRCGGEVGAIDLDRAVSRVLYRGRIGWVKVYF